MEADAKSFTFLGAEGKVTIPFFQRSYVWEEKNWQELLDDLLRLDRGHFLGSLILKQMKGRAGKPKEVLVIDGQQRLTTLSILLKALYDTFPSDTQQHCVAALHSILFYKENQTTNKQSIKLQHSRLDRQAYEKVVLHTPETPLIECEQKKTGIVGCYCYYVERFKKLDFDVRTTLFDYLTNPTQDNKILVVIDLVEDEDEQKIFDTINSAGVKLSSADIIKNALFQRAIQLSDEKTATELYKNTWEHVFLRDDEAAFWDKSRTTGRLVRDNIEILLHAIAVVKNVFDPDEHTLSELAALYKKEFNKMQTIDAISALIHEICDYANIYREKIIYFDGPIPLSFTDVSLRTLHILDVLQITTFHPFILFLYKTYKGKDTEVEQLLINLQKFVIRRMVVGKETKSYNKLSKDFIGNPAQVVLKLESDEEVQKGLRNISNKHAALILFWIELYRRSSNPKFDIKELNYNYSLEHVMPQSWTHHWTDMPSKVKDDGTSMSIEEAKDDRNNKIYWIGNMTLLTSSLNSSLKHYRYDVKMRGEGKKRGMASYATLSITKDDLVIPFENGDLTWNENKIVSRTKALAEEFNKIWGVPVNA